MRVFSHTLVLILSLIVLGSPVCPQGVKDNLYSRGLKACLEKELESYKDFSSRDLRNVIVVQDDKVTYGLPSQFGEIKVEYLNLYELAQRYMSRKSDKDSRKDIPVIEISAIFDEGEDMFFAYRNSGFSYKRKGGFLQKKQDTFGFALEGGCRAKIRFDQVTRRYSIENTELWGV